MIELKGETGIAIESIHFDSRIVKRQSVFIAVKGLATDGHLYIDKAIERGAVAIVCEEFPEQFDPGVVYVKVKDAQLAMAHIAANFYDNPSRELKLIGITGTNGKTTTTSLLFELFRKLGYKCGLVSTIVNKIDRREIPSTHTTPDPIKLNHLFRQMLNEGDKTFKSYIQAKKAFFDGLGETAFALYNNDDPNGSVMVQNTKARKYSMGIRTMADYKTKVLENHFDGLHLSIGNIEIYTSLVGLFNAYNLMTVFAVGDLLEQDHLEMLTAISTLKAVEGRFQFNRSDNNVMIIVDYAHTPDARREAIKTACSMAMPGDVILIAGKGHEKYQEINGEKLPFDDQKIVNEILKMMEK